MGRPPSTHEKTRLNLEIPTSVRERIERIRAATEADSLTEVIRRAVAVYEMLVQAKASGAKVVIREGRVEREVVIT